MASVIEDKTYELITKTENFDFAYDIYERFDSITERLIIEFWNLLILKLKKELPDYKFTDRNSPNPHFDITIKPLTKIMFYVGIYDSQFQYGISITHNGTKKKIQELEDKFKDVFEEYEYNEKNKVSWFFENGEESFSTLFGLKKILPENRSILIDKYINDFKVMLESKRIEFTKYEENIK